MYRDTAKVMPLRLVLYNSPKPFKILIRLELLTQITSFRTLLEKKLNVLFHSLLTSNSTLSLET